MKDPAMLLYTSDFLAGTYLLSMEERGQFITIICLQQQHGHMELGDIEIAVGFLSDNLLKLLSVDEDGKYYNERADFEIARRKKYSQKQSDISRKRWAGNATALPIETEKEKETEKGIETETGIGSEKEDDPLPSVKTPAETLLRKPAVQTPEKPEALPEARRVQGVTVRTPVQPRSQEVDFEGEIRRLKAEARASHPNCPEQQISHLALGAFLRQYPGYFTGVPAPPAESSLSE